MIQILVTNGAEVNVVDGDGQTPLIIAASLGDAETVKYLVESGAKINQKNKAGHSAYDYARASNQEMANYLKAHGAK